MSVGPHLGDSFVITLCCGFCFWFFSESACVVVPIEEFALFGCGCCCCCCCCCCCRCCCLLICLFVWLCECLFVCWFSLFCRPFLLINLLINSLLVGWLFFLLVWFLLAHSIFVLLGSFVGQCKKHACYLLVLCATILVHFSHIDVCLFWLSSLCLMPLVQEARVRHSSTTELTATVWPKLLHF